MHPDSCMPAHALVKFAWKIQRDMAERGHSLESIKASIEARKPDFDAFIDPQKQKADVIIQARSPFCSASATSVGCYLWLLQWQAIPEFFQGMRSSRHVPTLCRSCPCRPG